MEGIEQGREMHAWLTFLREGGTVTPCGTEKQRPVRKRKV